MVWKEWLAASPDALPVSRGEALSVPSVVRALAQITSPLMECPWVQLDAAGVPTPTQPKWLQGTSGEVAPQYRAQLVGEDLVLDGWSLLSITRDGANRITAVDRVPYDQWMFTDDGEPADEDGDPFDPLDIVLVKGPHRGLLNNGARTVRGAVALEQAWTRAIRAPIPITTLTQTTDDQLDDDEVDELLADWRHARSDPDGAVAFIPYGIELDTPGTLVPELLVAARNAVAVDIARLVGLPSAAVDAGAVQASLTYVNTQLGVGLQLVNQGVKPYATAMGAALSLDNVTPSGTRIGLDMSQLLADAATLSPNGPNTED